MSKRDFSKWFSTFIDSIATYSYYVDFDKVYGNVNNIKLEVHSESPYFGIDLPIE